MNITWLGQSCFKIQSKEAIIVTDPYSQRVGLPPPRVTADIVTISHDHYDHNNYRTIKGNPFVISTPGEFEVKGVAIQGIPAWHDDQEGAERGANTIFVLTTENIRLAHLGDLGTKLDEAQLDKINGVDILCIPVGGIYTITAKQAAEVIKQIEPRIIIPMHYKIPKLKIKLNPIELFLQEMGIKQLTMEDKLRVTKKDLPAEETNVIVLKP